MSWAVLRLVAFQASGNPPNRLPVIVHKLVVDFQSRASDRAAAQSPLHIDQLDDHAVPGMVQDSALL